MEMMSANDVTFGSLKVLFNSQINDVMVVKIRQYDGSYVPRNTFPLNRTLVHTESSTVTQMEIMINLCEVVLPSNHNNFKQYVFRDLVNYMLKSIETISVNIVNEIGFKLFFYVPSDSPAANSQWWEDTGITKKSWNRHDMNYNQTLLGTGLNGNYVRYCLTIYLDDNRQLISSPVTPLVSNQYQQYQSNPWSSSLPQTSPWGSSPVNIWGNSTSNALNTSGGTISGGNTNGTTNGNNPWGTSWSSASVPVTTNTNPFERQNATTGWPTTSTSSYQMGTPNITFGTSGVSASTNPTFAVPTGKTFGTSHANPTGTGFTF